MHMGTVAPQSGSCSTIHPRPSVDPFMVTCGKNRLKSPAWVDGTTCLDGPVCPAVRVNQLLATQLERSLLPERADRLQTLRTRRHLTLSASQLSMKFPHDLHRAASTEQVLGSCTRLQAFVQVAEDGAEGDAVQPLELEAGGAEPALHVDVDKQQRDDAEEHRWADQQDDDDRCQHVDCTA